MILANLIRQQMIKSHFSTLTTNLNLPDKKLEIGYPLNQVNFQY